MAVTHLGGAHKNHTRSGTWFDTFRPETPMRVSPVDSCHHDRPSNLVETHQKEIHRRPFVQLVDINHFIFQQLSFADHHPYYSSLRDTRIISQSSFCVGMVPFRGQGERSSYPKFRASLECRIGRLPRDPSTIAHPQFWYFRFADS